VTLVRELLVQLSRGEIAGVPSPHVIRLSAEGQVYVEGPVGAGGHPIGRAAQLLDGLLPTAESGPQFRVPGGLRLVIGRALGMLDLPPFASIDEFATALSRFSATDAAAMVASLVGTWTELVAERSPDGDQETPPAPVAQIEPFVAARGRDPRPSAGPLTVSDIRRARRATGVELSVIAERSRIPLALLRQLEWGYVSNWPTGRYGRTQLMRYARAAGLDEQLVVSAITPLIEEIEERQLVLAAAPAHPAPLEDVQEPAIEIAVMNVPQDGTASRRRVMGLVALACAALIVIAVSPSWRWSSPARQTPPPLPGEAAAISTTPGVAQPSQPHQPAADRTSSRARELKALAAQPPAVASPPKIEHEQTAPVRTAYRVPSDDVTYSPAFSSEGTAMFYHETNNGGTALMRADTDSRGAVLRVTRIVDDPSKNYHVRPSPDGSRIAFDSDRDGVRGVYVADADGHHVRRVSPEGFAAIPSWSPDSTTLAFVRADASRPRVWNLWTLDLQTGDLRQVTNRTYGQPWGGSWFPDGRRIAYSHEDRLILHDLQTGTERIFPTPRQGRLVRTPAVSPDGRRIMFQVYRDGAWMLELGDGSMRRILDDPSAEEYTWAPDGKRVAYHSSKTGEWGVWVMAPR
jgi:catechol 2,3-dioxygenase-like lactoylglutathione lyase family enzyme